MRPGFVNRLSAGVRFIQYPKSVIQYPQFDNAAGGHPVVSLYLNVDGSRYARRGDYEAEYGFMVHEARRTAAENPGFSKDQLEEMDADLQAVGEFLALEFRREGARGLIIFSCRTRGLWQVQPLKVPVKNRLFVDLKPRLAPLARMLSRHRRFGVLLASKETARLLEHYAGEISENSEIFDMVLKHHSQGGWEQAKLQRRHQLQVRNHLKKAGDAALAFFQEKSLDLLVVGISEDLWPELEKVLHPYLKERLAGRFNIDISADANEIRGKVEAIEEGIRAREQEALLASLGPELAAGKTYVGGLDDVLAALNERRVDLLIVESGYAKPGRRCPGCNTIEFGEESCPSCRTKMQAVNDIVEEAEELAVRQDAVVIEVPPGNASLAQAEKIAARLRY